MKFFLVLSLLCASVFASEFTTKDPQIDDLSVDKLTSFYCVRSSYFNPQVCVDEIKTCFAKYRWTKTVLFEEKLHVFHHCAAKVIR